MSTQISGDTGVSQCQPNSVSQDDLQSGVTGKGPAFRATGASNVSATSDVPIKITYATVSFDTDAAYSIVNSRFTPQVAGYYQVTAIIQYNQGGSSPGAASLLSAFVMRNGVSYSEIGVNAVSDFITAGGTCLVYMNGVTDYLEVFGKHTSGGTKNIIGREFSASLVRAA